MLFSKIWFFILVGGERKDVEIGYSLFSGFWVFDILTVKGASCRYNMLVRSEFCADHSIHEYYDLSPCFILCTSGTKWHCC